MAKRPGGELAKRELHFIWIVDCSGSMSANGKIQSLNFAIHEATPEMRRVADENPNAEIRIRALRFADGAHWHIATATDVQSFKWNDILAAGGSTRMGEALKQVAKELRVPPMTDHALPPVLVLITDGQPTDNFKEGLDELLKEPWGKKAVRIAIGIGKETTRPDVQQVLTSFVSNPEIPVLQADNAETLAKYIRWASTKVLQAASAPPSQVQAAGGGNVPVPAPPPSAPTSASDVW